jgi:3-dehydroquinate dehydratase-2
MGWVCCLIHSVSSRFGDFPFASNGEFYWTKCNNFGKLRRHEGCIFLFERHGKMGAKSILVIHGPNLNMLGTREPQHYGSQTLADINQHLQDLARADQVRLETFQSNSEADIIEKIHALSVNKVDYVIINPAAFTHTSIAIRDALSAVKIPFIEVHLSNVHARESFRHHSYFSDLATAVICGLGAEGYYAAYRYIQQH